MAGVIYHTPRWFTRAFNHLALPLTFAILRSDEIFPLLREVSNVWCFEKDGKVYDASASRKAMKK